MSQTLAGSPNFAPMRLDNIPGDRQTNTTSTPGTRARFIDAVKTSENFLQMLGIQTYAGI